MKRLNTFLFFLIMTFIFTPLQLFASKIFNISISNYGSLNHNLVDRVISAVEQQVLDKIPDTDRSEFFNNMSNASAIAGKDLGYDPINHIDFALITLGVGAGLDLNKKNFSELKNSSGNYDLNSAPGIGAQLGLGLGVKGTFLPKKKFDGEKWDLFLNYMPYNYHKDDVAIKMRSGGLHFRYQLWQGKKVLPWNMFSLLPVYLGFGYEYNKLSGSYSQKFNISKRIQTYSATFDATANLNLDIATHSFPLEISSGFQLLYLLSIYGGLGMDLNRGHGTGSGDLSSSTVIISDGTTAARGTATLGLGDEGKPKSMWTRYFAGVQLNLWKAMLFVQGEKAFGRHLYGAQAGLKISF